MPSDVLTALADAQDGAYAVDMDQRILAKLNVPTCLEAVVAASRQGLLQ